jgi:hypothetical protein
VNAATRGQAAYEACRKFFADTFGQDDTLTWGELDADEQVGFEKLAQAVAGAIAAQQPQPAPELAATPRPRVDWARVSEVVADRERERDEARAVVADMLDCFSPSGSGHTARVGQVQITKWRTRAGLTS